MIYILPAIFSSYLQMTLLDLFGTLDIDVQNTDFSVGLNRFDSFDRSSIVLAMHFGILDEFAIVNVLFDLFDRGKVVVNTILFPLPWWTCRMRNGKSQLFVGKSFHQHFNQGSLSNTRWATNDDGLQFIVGGHGRRFAWAKGELGKWSGGH